MKARDADAEQSITIDDTSIRVVRALALAALHPLMLFLAFVGGLIAFGPSGLILGSCIIAFTVGLAEVWRDRQVAESEAGGA